MADDPKMTADLRPPTPQGNGQVSSLDQMNMLAGQIVTPLQHIVVKLGQILQSLGGVTGFYGIKSLAFANSPYTTLATDEYLVVDATGGNVVINLSAIGNPQISVIKSDATANQVQLVGTINNVANLNFNTQYLAYRLKRDAANKWWLF